MRLIIGLLAFLTFAMPVYAEKKPRPVNNMPKTMQDYYRAVNKAADSASNIPEPQEEKDTKIVDIPPQQIGIRKYNTPPGMVDINLNNLKKTRKVNSIGVASPEFNKMAYTVVYYYPATKTASSELFLMDLDTGKPVKERIEDAHINKGKTLLFRTGMDSLDLNIQRTLTIVDWSTDGKKIALKEKIANNADGTWKTSLLVYDLETKKMKNLSEVREAIRYYWQKTDNLYLKDYRWDIYPMGWDSLNPDRIVVFAYASTGEKPKFLGAWSVDYYGDRSMLMSPLRTKFEVSQNGSCLRTIQN